MADIEDRELVAERMLFQFNMIETDKEGFVQRKVCVELDCPDSVTHPEITEAFQNFLTACGYVFDGEIRHVQRGSEF